MIRAEFAHKYPSPRRGNSDEYFWTPVPDQVINDRGISVLVQGAADFGPGAGRFQLPGCVFPDGEMIF